ncbi:MAG: carboxypeptidase-like regulatory domain-containing protein [Cyanobacteriota bacterium]
MKKIIYSTICSLLVFSCSEKINKISNEKDNINNKIKSITVKSKKDGYIVAKTGGNKVIFTFDSKKEGEEVFNAEVEYQDGTKSDKVIWESFCPDSIKIDNGIITANKIVAYCDITIKSSENNLEKVLFSINFVEKMIVEGNICNNKTVNKRYVEIDPNESARGYIGELKEKCTISGIVYDRNSNKIENTIVKAKTIDSCWEAESKTDKNGQYVFRNVLVGPIIEITAEKNGFSKTRKEIAKPNLTGDPKANTFDFGRGNSLNDTDSENLYFLF